MSKNVLLITTDQQRYDSLGCTGGLVASTPVLDGIARDGIIYRQARNQCPVCMPARSTILTGQHIRMHGVTSNGIPLPVDHPSLLKVLKAAGYSTALIGKAHFEPHAAKTFFENCAASENSYGPYRGFDHMELCGHTGRVGRSLFHYPKWLAANHPKAIDGFHEYTSGGNPSVLGGGDTFAPQVSHNPIEIEQYHTHWTARRTLNWLGQRKNCEKWFCWMSFPDPHHPWDVPDKARKRFNWRELDLPISYPGSRERCEEILSDKPWHWLAWYQGLAQLNFEVPPAYIPAQTTADQIREINAIVHAKNELIDEAIGLVTCFLRKRGWDQDTEIFFTTDHGEMQGDFGMLFKGPYHVDALTKVPLIWRPAPVDNITPVEINEPVGHLDIAPTILNAVGLQIPEFMQGKCLPMTAGDLSRERVITEWIDSYDGNEIVMRTMVRNNYLITAYEKTNRYDGTEGELYSLGNDPNQWRNLWNDSGSETLKSELMADLYDNLPVGREFPLEKIAPV